MKFIEQARAITKAYKERYWAATDAIAGSGSPPPEPSMYETAMAGKQIDVEALPAMKMIEAAAKAGTS